jgi:Zn-dependent protease
MMQARWQIGSVGSIPIYVAPSWFGVVVLITLGYGLRWSADYPEWGQWGIWVASVVMTLLLFGSVLLHEFGHSWIAQTQGIPVRSVTLFLFGGIAAIEKEAATPAKTAQLAIAGPVVSLVLSGFMLGVSGWLPPVAQVIASRLGHLNGLLGLMNLVPALPLDGGHLLVALIWQMSHNRLQGLRWAAKAGLGLGFVAIVTGLGFITQEQEFVGGWMALLGWFVLSNAGAYARMTDLQQMLLQLRAKNALSPNVRMIDGQLTLSQFATAYLQSQEPALAYGITLAHGQKGVLEPNALSSVERSQWESQTLSELAQVLSADAVVSETASLADIIQTLEAESNNWLAVISSQGDWIGLTNRTALVQALAQQPHLPIQPLDIQHTQTTGLFPPDLQLPRLAQAAIAATPIRPELILDLEQR